MASEGKRQDDGKKFRPGWYRNNPDPPVTICDVEKVYMEARQIYDPSYSHPQWGEVAKSRACTFIDTLTMAAHQNGDELSITTIIRDCVSRWDLYRHFVQYRDDRVILGEEPSITGLIKSYSLAVEFSRGEEKKREMLRRSRECGREKWKSWRLDRG
jgi:hypothetical protein